MTPSKQTMDPLTIEQLDALETYNAGVKMGAHGQGADRITTLRLIAMARRSIAKLNAPEPNKSGLSHPCKDTCSGWKQGYDEGRRDAQPGAEDEE